MDLRPTLERFFVVEFLSILNNASTDNNIHTFVPLIVIFFGGNMFIFKIRQDSGLLCI